MIRVRAIFMSVSVGGRLEEKVDDQGQGGERGRRQQGEDERCCPICEKVPKMAPLLWMRVMLKKPGMTGTDS